MSRLARLSLLALLFVAPAVSPAVAADPPTWKAGFAAAVITPPKPMWMSGYAARTKPAEGTETDLFAKAALLEDADGRKLLLVSLDLVGIDRDTSLGIRAGLTKAFDIPTERIVLACSHTHCGPVVGKNLRSMYLLDAEQNKLVDDYTAALPGLIEKAVAQAVKNLEPVSLNGGQGTCTFAVNRRENKEAEVPDRVRAGTLKGPVDHDVPVLVATDKAGKVKGVVFGYACHATTLSYQKWSGDYPGYAMLAVEKANPGAVAVFWAGCGADQNPIPRRSQELAEKYGRQLADAVAAAMKQRLAVVKPTSAAVYKEIDLRLHELPTRDRLATESQSADKYVAARAKMLLDKLKTAKELPAGYPYPVQAWRLGDRTWLHLGGEVVVDYAVRFKKEYPGLWVTAYANDVMAYIPSARVRTEGGYEGGGAMVYYGLPSVWGTDVEDRIAAEVARQVKAVAGK